MGKAQKRLFLAFAVFAALLATVVILWLQELVGPRALGILLLIVIGLFGLAITKIFSGLKRELNGETSQSSGRSMWRLKVAGTALPIILVFGWLETQDEPLAPRLVGACINLLFTALIWSALRRKSKEERQ